MDPVKVGSTNVTTYFQLRNVADGTDATGKTITAFDLQYVRSGIAPVAKVDATALAAADSAHADNKMIEVDSTDTPGLYRVDWPDAAFATGVREVALTVKHTDIQTATLRVTLDPPVNVVSVNSTPAAAVDLQDFATNGYDSDNNRVFADVVAMLAGDVIKFFGEHYYVDSTAGSDSAPNDGTKDNPFKTIGKCLSVGSNGMTVHVIDYATVQNDDDNTTDLEWTLSWECEDDGKNGFDPATATHWIKATGIVKFLKVIATENHASDPDIELDDADATFIGCKLGRLKLVAGSSLLKLFLDQTSVLAWADTALTGRSIVIKNNCNIAGAINSFDYVDGLFFENSKLGSTGTIVTGPGNLSILNCRWTGNVTLTGVKGGIIRGGNIEGNFTGGSDTADRNLLMIDVTIDGTCGSGSNHTDFLFCHIHGAFTDLQDGVMRGCTLESTAVFNENGSSVSDTFIRGAITIGVSTGVKFNNVTYVSTLTDNSGGTFERDFLTRKITDTLTTSAEITDDVWDELLAAHVAAGSFGKSVGDIEGDTNEIQGKVPTNKIMGSSTVTDKDDEIDAIKAKTDNLPASPANEVTSALIKTETDKIALVDAGAGVAGSVIEEVENRATPAQVNTEVDNALDTAIPAAPAANSINERIRKIDELNALKIWVDPAAGLDTNRGTFDSRFLTVGKAITVATSGDEINILGTATVAEDTLALPRGVNMVGHNNVFWSKVATNLTLITFAGNNVVKDINFENTGVGGSEKDFTFLTGATDVQLINVRSLADQVALDVGHSDGTGKRITLKCCTIHRSINVYGRWTRVTHSFLHADVNLKASGDDSKICNNAVRDQFIIEAGNANSVVTENSVKKEIQDSGTDTLIRNNRKDVILHDGVVVAGAASTITLDALASSVDDFYNNALICIIIGTGENQCRTISDYDGGTKVATVQTPWAAGEIPDATSRFIIIPFGNITATATSDLTKILGVTITENNAGDLAGAFSQYFGFNISESKLWENRIIDNITYQTNTDGTKSPTSWDVELYPSKADAVAKTNLIRRFKITQSYNTDDTLKDQLVTFE